MRPGPSLPRRVAGFCLLLLSLCLPACHRGLSTREITPGGIEISAQPSPDQLLSLIRAKGLRSVLNLRSEDRRRFAEEESACRRAGAEYFACAIPLEDWTPRPKLLRVVEILDTAPRPMLIHCRNGVDRSGLAAAVALLLEDRSLKEAWEQMPTFARRRASRGGRPLARVLLDYENFLRSKDRASSGEIFRAWVKVHYCPEPYRGRVELPATPPNQLKTPGKLRLRVRVTNFGEEDWDLSSGGVSLGLRLAPIPLDEGNADAADLFEPGNTDVIDCGRFRPDQKSLVAHAQLQWDAVFDLPARPGRYLARVDLLREGRHWFSDMGWEAPTWELGITPYRE